MAKRYGQLEELSAGRLPKIWLVEAKVDGDRLTFEIGYLGNGYGGSVATLVPVGRDSPQIRVAVPEAVRNMQNGVVLASGGFFTIEGTIE
jgi:hypothetical protein